MPDFEMFCFQLECFKKVITFALPLEIVYHSLYYSLQKRGISHTVHEKFKDFFHHGQDLNPQSFLWTHLDVIQ